MMSSPTQVMREEPSVEREDPFARQVRDALWVVAATVSLVAALLVFAYFPVAGWRQILARVTFALTALALAPLALRWKRNPPALEQAHLAMGGLAIVAVASAAVQFLTMQVPIYTVNLAVVLVASSALMLSRRWLGAITVSLIAVWCVVGLQHLETPAWDGYRMILPRVAVVAFGVQEALRRSAHRSWRLRVEIERRQREREATTAKLEAAQRLESLETIAGGLAHDFNNLLVAMMGNAELAEYELPADSPALDSLARVAEAGEHAKSLTGQLLAFSGGARAQPTVLRLDREVAELEGLLAAALPKGTPLSIEQAPSPPPVEVDRSRFQQVLMNLVVNAGEARPGDMSPVVIRTDRRMLSETEASELYPPQKRVAGDFVFVEVRDLGHGMDRATQSRMYEPFFSLKGPGRGLGLSAVLGIVRGHQGGLEVTSRPGTGTSVRVYFRAAERTLEPETNNAEPTGLLLTRSVVLVVDDEPQVRLVAARLLEAMGATVIEAANGKAAIEELEGGARPHQRGAARHDDARPVGGGHPQALVGSPTRSSRGTDQRL